MHFRKYKADQEKEVIRQALEQWEAKTCLEFKEIKANTNQVHYLQISKGQGFLIFHF